MHLQEPSSEPVTDAGVGDSIAGGFPALMQQAVSSATPESVNESLVRELGYIGLLDPDDDSRLREKDCEDDALCIQIRAWQDSLRMVTATTDATRKALHGILKPKMAKIQTAKRAREEEDRFIALYTAGIKPPETKKKR